LSFELSLVIWSQEIIEKHTAVTIEIVTNLKYFELRIETPDILTF